MTALMNSAQDSDVKTKTKEVIDKWKKDTNEEKH